MAKRAATPVRFDEDVATRLAAFAGSRPGLSLSAAANQLVDEGLRMAEHPGVVFRDGATGRRAGLRAGPDVWEVIRAIRSVRTEEPAFDEAQIIDMVCETSDLPNAAVRVAIGYWSAYPVDIEDRIAASDVAETEAHAAWYRQRELLARAAS